MRTTHAVEPAAPSETRAPARVAPVPPRVTTRDERLVSLLAPHSYEAEQYRVLRHMIEQTYRASGLSIVAVSSPDVGEGKTTTAINLAGSLAQASDVRVLLIDADLRRPAVATRLGLDPDAPGVVDAILTPGLDFAAVAQPFSSTRLSIVSAGRFSGAPHEIMHSPRLGELLAACRSAFDYVIVDTPPLIPIPDARVLGKWVDGILLVVCANKTPRKMVEESLNLLSPDKTLGLVFNNDTRPPARHQNYYHPTDRRPAAARRTWWSRIGGTAWR